MKEQEKGSWLTALLEWAICESAVTVAAFSTDKKGVRALPAEGTAPRAWGALGMLSSSWGARIGQKCGG